MPRRYMKKRKDDDEFESEVFSFLNQKPQSDADDSDKTGSDEDSDRDDLGNEEAEYDEATAAADDDDDDDDDAPEDIAFQDSKKSALAQVRSALQQIGSEKERKKEARKKMDAQFKKQKAEKLKHLAKAKLPDEILDEIDDHIPQKKKKIEKLSKKKTKVLKDTPCDNEGEQEESQGTEVHRAGDMGDDFIAFTDSASGVQVAEIKAIERRTKSLAQTAAEFRNNRLYGKHIRRESNKDRMAVAEKRRQRFR